MHKHNYTLHVIFKLIFLQSGFLIFYLILLNMSNHLSKVLNPGLSNHYNVPTYYRQSKKHLVGIYFKPVPSITTSLITDSHIVDVYKPDKPSHGDNNENKTFRSFCLHYKYKEPSLEHT